MLSPISPVSSLMPSAAANRFGSESAGPLDALANYWLTKLAYLDAGDRKAIPEFNLGPAADETLCQYMRRRGLTNQYNEIEANFSDGFAFGMHMAAILAECPFNAEAPIRSLIDELVDMIEDRRKDDARCAAIAAAKAS